MGLKLKPFNPVAMLQDDEIADHLTKACLDEDLQVSPLVVWSSIKGLNLPFFMGFFMGSSWLKAYSGPGGNPSVIICSMVHGLVSGNSSSGISSSREASRQAMG